MLVNTDEAPIILGITSGLIKLIKDKSPEVISIYYLINKQELISRFIPEELLTILKIVIKTVNFMVELFKKSAILKNV